MTTEITSKYKCSENEFYAIVEIILQNLTNDQPAFVAKKAKYTPAFIAGLQGQRTAAIALPDEESRNGVHQSAKNLLPGLVTPCKDNFNDLKGYIRDGWANEDPRPRYEAAGLTDYNDIGVQNWEAVLDLNEQMLDFINDAVNNPILITPGPGGAPATFPAKVLNDANAFEAQYNLFMVSRQTTTARNAKIQANNDLYDAIMDVCEDGKTMIYRNDSGGKKRYTWDTIKNMVSAPGAASLKVTGKHANDTLVTAADVEIKQTGKPAITVQLVNGFALASNIDPGDYTGKIIIGGNVVATFNKDVNVGTNARIEVQVP
jgi:hypothetical protein